MLCIQEAIVVEGRYDKNTLAQLVDTVILTTDGFAVFKNEERLALLRRVARERGLIILTDSDGAGFVIRNFLKGAIPGDQLKQAYIPDIYGKERRKRAPGKEGKLGVEGMRPQVLEQALRRAGATFLDQDADSPLPRRPITKADLFADGLSGGPDAGEKRRRLLKQLDLPEHMTANALLEMLNLLFTWQEYRAAVDEIQAAADIEK
jgi:ribonuclease M5